MSRPKQYKTAYREQLLKKIEALTSQVFTRKDLSKSKANRAQLRLNRALKVFINKGIITKISHGLYAKSFKMELPDGSKKTVLHNSFEDIAAEALNKLGIKWELGKAIQEYNQGISSQVPAIFSVRLQSRFRGTIEAQGRKVFFEDNINAK